MVSNLGRLAGSLCQQAMIRFCIDREAWSSSASVGRLPFAAYLAIASAPRPWNFDATLSYGCVHVTISFCDTARRVDQLRNRLSSTPCASFPRTYQQYAEGVHIRLLVGVIIEVQQLGGHVRHGANALVLDMLAQSHGGTGSPTKFGQPKVAKLRGIILGQQYCGGVPQHVHNIRGRDVLVLGHKHTRTGEHPGTITWRQHKRRYAITN